MKFKIEKRNFTDAMKFSYSVCNMSTTYSPILSCLHFDVTKEKITIISSCSSVSSKWVIPGDKYECIEEGKFMVKAKVINDIVSKLDNSIITFALLESNQLAVNADKFESTLLLLDHNDYPNIDFDLESGDTSECSFKTDELLEVENRISNLISQDENKTIFSNINFFVQDKKFTICASDRFKVGSLTFPTESNDTKFNLDPVALRLICSLFKPEENVSFKINDNKICVKYNNITLITRMYSGSFPSFEHFGRVSEGDNFTISRKELISAIERGMTVISNKVTPSVKFKFTEDNNLNLSFFSEEIGTATEVLTVSELSNKDLTFIINIQMLLMVLKNFTGETIKIWFKQDMSIILFKDVEQENFFQAIAAIRNNY